MLKQVLFVAGKIGIMFSVRAIDAVETKQYHAQIYKVVVVNEGGCFDKATGIFTAPCTGAYVLSVRAESNKSDVEVSSYIMIDDKSSTIAHGGYHGSTVCELVQLKYGEKVWIAAGSSGDKYDAVGSRNSFYCFLVQGAP